MATLREIRQRIGGVRKTQKITRAMKMVAAAKLRRAQANVVAARPYALKMKELLQQLRTSVSSPGNPFLTPRPVSRNAIVVVTSNRGLCGSFNANLIRAVTLHIAQTRPAAVSEGTVNLFCVGKKGLDYFTRRGYRIVGKHVAVFNDLVFGGAQAIAREIIEGYLKGEYDKVELVYNEFKSVAQQRVVVEQFLPVPEEEGTAGPHRTVDYIYEPDKVQIIDALVPRHLSFQIWRVLLESFAAEQGARMVAMENATENANELISTLQLQYNKARQAAITKELLEVVSGAEALKGTA